MRNFKNKHEEGMAGKTNLHQGHRGRLRNEVSQTKLVDMNDYKMMEYCLQVCIPRRDTNPLAHQLINIFGTFASVCDAEENVLRERAGVTKNIAHFLHHLPYVLRNYEKSKLRPKATLTSAQEIFEYFGHVICSLPIEEFYVILLDGADRVITQRMISFGNDSQVGITAKEVLKFAIDFNARKVIMVHNHPTTSHEPSIEDIEATKRIYFMLTSSGIDLFEHLIVSSQGEYFSFAREGILSQFENDYKRVMK